MADHNVFISHRHEDDAYLGQLKELLKRKGCDIRDSSVNSATPNSANSDDYIKSLLRGRINWAGKVIVLVSPDTKNHEWVDWEIEYTKQFPDKRIIGVWTPDADGCEIPDPLKLYADAMVSWNAQDIIDAVEGRDNWQNPDGSPRSEQLISRIGC